MARLSKITPCLWFDDRIEDAVNFYISVFGGGKILDTARYSDAGPLPKGKVMTMVFEILGQEFMALNGGPQFTFSEAISFVVHCETQSEVDYYWSKLTADGGKESMCGWLKDRIRPLMADRARCGDRAAQGPRQGPAGHGSRSHDEEDRHCGGNARARGIAKKRSHGRAGEVREHRSRP